MKNGQDDQELEGEESEEFDGSRGGGHLRVKEARQDGDGAIWQKIHEEDSIL